MPIQFPLATTVEEAPGVPGALADMPEVSGTITLETPKVRSGGQGYSTIGDLAEGMAIGLGLPATYVSDAVLNRFIDAAVASGMLPPETDRDLATRFFYSRQYEQAVPILGGSKTFGKGDYVGFTNAPGRIGEQTGLGTTLSLPMIATAGQAGPLLLGAEASQLARGPVALTQASQTAGRMAGEGTTQSVLRGLLTEQGAASAAAPARYGATELGIGALAGGVTQGAEEIMPGSGNYVALSPLALIAGGKGLGFFGQKYFEYSPAGQAIKWASEEPAVGGYLAEAKDRLTGFGGRREKRAESKVAERIRVEANRPQALEERKRAGEVNRRISEVVGEELELTPAEVTMAPALGPDQARIEGRMTGETLARNNERKLNNLNRLMLFREKLFGGGQAAPSAILDEVSGRIDAVKTKTGASVKAGENSISNIADPVTGELPAMRPDEFRASNKSIRQQLVAMRDAAEQQADRIATKLKINAADPLGDAATSQTRLREALGVSETDVSYRGLPEPVRRFLEFNFQGKGKNGKISFQDWKQFRREVGGAIAAAKGEEKRSLAILQKELDGLAFGKAKTADNYRKFAQWYDANVILPFEDTVIRKVTRFGPGTRAGQDKYEYVLPAESVAKEFLKDSKTAEVFMRTFGDDPDYLDTMRNVVFDEARRASVRDGRIDPQRLAQFVEKNRQAFSVLKLQDPATGEPVAMDQFLSNISDTAGALLARQQSLQARQAVVNRYQLTKALSKVDGVGDNLELEQVIDEAIKNPKLMKQLNNSVSRGEDAENLSISLKREIANRIFTPKVTDNPETFGRFLAQNEKMLRNAFGDQHYEDLAVLNEGMRRTLATGGVSGGAGLTRNTLVDMFENATGVTSQGWSARMINMFEGRVSPRTTFVWLASQAAKARSLRSQDQAFERAMFDKDFAKTLTEATPDIGTITVPQSKKLAEKFFAYGIADPSDPEMVSTTVEFGPTEPAPTRVPVPPVQTTPEPAPAPAPAPEPAPAPFQMPVVPYKKGSAEPPQGGVGSMPQYGTLFPNDSLGQAIAQRGIMSLQG